MERLSLSPRHRSIDFRQCLPAGDILPSWSNLPLDTKLPMHKTAEGQITFFTTSISEPEYRSTQCIDFDLSDPLGNSLSTEYQSLHDPHLKSHFNLRSMKRHLVRNGFITPSGEVVCTLREFNQYRQYLRRLCLLEVTQERKEELASLEAVRVKKARPSKTELGPKFYEARKRQQEMLQKLKQRHEELIKMEEDKFMKKLELQVDKMVTCELKRKASEQRRGEILLRHKIKEEILFKGKNIELLKKSWIIKDQERNKRLNKQKTEKIYQQTQKNIENWHRRKIHEYERIERENQVREKERKKIEENIKLREQKIRKLRKQQLAQMNSLKMTRRRRQHNIERNHAQKLAHKIVTGNIHQYSDKGKKRSDSKYNSVWHFEEILKFLDSPEATDEPNFRTTSLDFLRSCNYSVDHTMQPMEDEQLKTFASDIVNSVINKVRNDYYGHYKGDRRDSDELELTFPEVDGRRRSVRFQNDEHIIPNLDSGATLTPGTAGALKPVSEHVLTPVPSPIPPELLHRDSVSEEVSKDGDGTLVETLLLRLLDDINNQRLSRHDLETLTSYCLQILRSHDLSSKNAEFQEKHELKRTTYSEVASELAQFTLEKILDDIKSGSVNDQDLTSITLALVRQRKQTNASPLENFVHGHILETLDRIVSEEGGIKSYVSQSLNKNEPGKREESFVAAVLSQAVSDIKSGAINDEDLKYIGSVVAANNDRSSGAEMSESEIKLSVEKVLNKIDITDLKKNNTIYSIISAYYTVNQRNKEAVKGFVLEAFPKICAAMKAPKSDRIKKNIKEFSKDLKDKSTNETDINHLGLQILYVGKKCLPPTLQDACTSYKEIVKNIKRILDRNEFQKEAEKVMYEFFTKDKKRRIGAMHGRPMIYIPSQESKVAINVVLGTMDRIIRDVYTQHIPPELLTALASEMYALCKKHDSIFDPTEEPAVNLGMPVLYRIYEKFRENKISFKDAKWIFATIFQTYSDPNSITVATEFQDISPNDRALIGNLVDETINKIVQTVAMEIKQELGGDTSNISVVEIEDLVREELYGLNESDDRSRELHHIEGDLEEILQGCLNKAARDIARHVEGVESETTVVKSRTKLSDMCFMEKVVDFILSAIDNLAKNAKSDDIKSSTLVEFLNRVLETDVKKLSPKQHQKILEEIRLNLEQNREESKYFPNLASLFSGITLDPRPKPSGLKEIPEIISSMESDVLMEFVQAAMFCVLSYIQGEQTASKDLPINDEFSFQRIESLLLVRKVLNYVVQNVSDIVETNGTKKSASKSLLKRFSSKKLDHKDTRSLYECIICAFKDAKAWLSQQRSVTLTPNVLATTDEKVLEHILDVTDLIQRKCDGKGPQSDISDEFEIICEMMINTINDIERGLDDPKELKLAFGSPVTEFDEESIQQYVLEAIKDALFHSNSSKKLSSVSDLSSGSSQTMIKIFALVLTNTIENIQNDKMPAEELKTLVDVLQNAAGLKVNVDFKDLKSVKNSVIQYLNKFKDSVDKGNVDDNTIQEVTKQIAMVDTSKTRSIDRENSIPPVSSEGNTQHIPTSVSNKPSEVIENMVKSVLSSVVADQKSQSAEAESRMKSNAVVNVEGKSSEVDNEKDPSLTTLKPILGSHPLDVGEDAISSALSHITMKPRATHHNPPGHEPRQSYRSLTCPDVHNYSQTKQAITEMIGTERAGSGAILSLKEESESIESIETSYSAESCNSVTGLKPKTASESAVKSNTSLRKGVSMETESTRSRESVKKQTSLGNSSTVASKKRSETIIKSSSIGSNKQKDSDVKKHTSQAETTNQSTDDNTSDLSDADYHYLLGRAND